MCTLHISISILIKCCCNSYVGANRDIYLAQKVECNPENQETSVDTPRWKNELIRTCNAFLDE